jgi:hypothetical protein
MGRFTLRDEGKTICIGKVLKYKPYTKTIVAGPLTTSASAQQVAKGLDELKVSDSNVNELVFDLETGETRPK